METIGENKGMVLTGRILTAVCGLGLLASAAMKIMGPDDFVKQWAGFGFAADLALTVGIIEIVCALLYLIPQTAMLGTTAGQVIQGLRQLGHTCQKAERTPETLVGPAMLFVDHPDIGPDAHAVLYVAHNDGHEIWDPAVGRKRLDSAGLRAIWRGRAVVCL